MPGYSIDLRSFVWPNGKTGSCRLPVKFGSAAVFDQMNLKPLFDGIVVNRHQLLFAIAANAYLRKRSHDPALRVGREMVQRLPMYRSGI